MTDCLPITKMGEYEALAKIIKQKEVYGAYQLLGAQLSDAAAQ